MILINKFLILSIFIILLPRVSFGNTNNYKLYEIKNYHNQFCSKLVSNITNKNIVFPLKLAVSILKAIYDTHPEQFMVSANGFLDKLYGSDILVKNIFNGSSIDELLVTWNKESLKFKEMIKPFRLY